jgi:hypothetical protein
MKVFLDCDGVLGGFDGHCLSLFGKTADELGAVELWRLVYQDAAAFWLGIPVLPGAAELVQYARQHDGTILTGCPYNPDDENQICQFAALYKPQWIEQNFGAGIPVITCFSRDKPKFMESTANILVDHFALNNRRWKKAGGRAILYKNADQALADLKLEIERGLDGNG